MTEARPTYNRIIVDGDDGDKEYEGCAPLIATCILLRSRYKDMDKGSAELLALTDTDPEPGPRTEFKMIDGVYVFSGQATQVIDWKKYIADVEKIFVTLEDGPCLSTARSRLTILEGEFELYSLLNSKLEEEADPLRKGGGLFAHNTKVDNNVHLWSAPNALQLVEEIIKTCVEEPNTVVGTTPEGKPNTLRGLLTTLNVPSAKSITVEGLGLHPPMRKRFHRFDALDPKLNVSGPASAELLQVFLRYNNFNHGKLFANVVQPILRGHDLREGRVIATEYQLPFYGSSADEWYTLAHWMSDNRLVDFRRNHWIVQIIRQNDLRAKYDCINNEDQLRHIFEPMFKATLDPDNPEFAAVAELLSKTGALSINSDETVRQKDFKAKWEPPARIPWSQRPDDYYFFYYIWANLTSLNALRARKRMNVIQFRPTAGLNAPHFDQLVSSFLLADSINHGLRLANSWLLQYLYMFTKIGIAMSPLGNNSMNIVYSENPFPLFFKRGLNVSLATEAPLHYHHSPEPLMEEYGTAKMVFELTSTDISEIALNSVLISSFPPETKAEWLGHNFLLGADGNDITKSCVCDFRLQFRAECLFHEQTVLNQMLAISNKVPFISVVKPRRQNLGMHGAMQVDQFRNQRRINYMDRRIHYPRIDIYGGVAKSRQYSPRSGGGGASAGVGAAQFRDILMLRAKYQRSAEQTELRAKNVTVEDVFVTSKEAGFQEDYWEYNNFYGVYVIYPVGRVPSWPATIPTMRDFVNDVSTTHKVVIGDSNLIALSHHRLQLLQHKFGLHLAMNVGKESGKKEEKDWNNRDFYTAYKVDGNLQLAAGMNARMMLHFFKEKALHNGHDVVEERDSRPVTLTQLLEELKIRNVDRLTVDELSYFMGANETLWSLFCSTDNYMRGRYFAELTQRVFEQHKLDAYTFVENRLTVTGKSPDEWHELSSWFDRYGMASKQNRWMINVPRRYAKLKKHVSSFGEWLENIFKPLWEVSLHPASHTKFHYFLSHVSGFDTIDDESKVDLPLSDVLPHDWKDPINPPYNYFMYFLWANITSLNEFRASRGLNTFQFRPQCGEQGGLEHLVGGFLLAKSINHGVQLMQSPTLEYLFYVAQIGITMSPLSNTVNSIPYLENPFPTFFRRGLKVSLATNEPLHFHYTQEPLIEEYGIAHKIWKLSYNDLCEVARNSVLISGFSDAFKSTALGPLHFLHSPLGNDVKKSRVSDIRVAYRYETYHTELNFLDDLLGDSMPRALQMLEKEVDIYEEKTGTKVEMPTDGLDGDEVETVESLQAQIQEATMQIKRGKIQMQSLAEANIQLTKEIQRILKSSREPMKLSANLSDLSQFLQSQ